MKNLLIVSILLFLSVQVNAQPHYQEYKVQKGQSIGQILFDLGISPLWGPKGNVRKTIDLNSHLLDKNGNVVQANAIIRIPVVESVRLISSEPEVTQNPIQQIGTPTIEEASDDLLNSLLSVTAGLQYWEIKSTERADSSHARLQSMVSPSIDARWTLLWDKFTETYLGANLVSISFKQPNEKHIRNATESYGELYIGQKFHLDKKWTLSGEFKNLQRPYLRALSNSELKIESPWMKQINLGVERKLVIKKNGYLSVKISPYYILGNQLDDFNVRSGIGGRIDIKVGQQFKKFSAEASFFSDYSQQDSNISKQQTQYNGILFRLNFPLGGSSF